MVYTGEELREYMQKRRARIKQEMRDLLGNSCKVCGTDSDLEFDHIDPATKLFQISGRGLDKPLPLLITEVAKCQLLCRLHHKEKTKVEASVPRPDRRTAQHGDVQMYNRWKCRCPLCREAKRLSRG